MKLSFNNRRLIIRADADVSIGTGHVMRGLALAQTWRDCGGEVIFVGKIVSALQQKIKEHNCTYLEIKRPYPAADDLELMISLMRKSNGTYCQWIIVDGYHFTADYTECLRRAGAKVLLIDDNAHQKEYSADLLLNQNIGSDEFYYNLNQGAKLLLGTKYALLRHEFLKEQIKTDNIIPEEARHILVTLGGADSDNITLRVIEALDLLDCPKLKVKIVVGAANRHFNLLKDRMDYVSFQGKLITEVRNMAPLMTWADMAVTAGGSTCWELAYMGVAFIVIVVADNQERIAENLHKADCIHYWGWSYTLEKQKMRQSLTEIVFNKSERARLISNGSQLVDGQGSQRVLKVMEEF